MREGRSYPAYVRQHGRGEHHCATDGGGNYNVCVHLYTCNVISYEYEMAHTRLKTIKKTHTT